MHSIIDSSLFVRMKRFVPRHLSIIIDWNFIQPNGWNIWYACLDKRGKILDINFYNQSKSDYSSLFHTVDFHEEIPVKLEDLDQRVKSLFFGISCYEHNLAIIQKCSVRIHDTDRKIDWHTMSLTDFENRSTIILFTIYRIGFEWLFQELRMFCNNQSFQDCREEIHNLEVGVLDRFTMRKNLF